MRVGGHTRAREGTNRVLARPGMPHDDEQVTEFRLLLGDVQRRQQPQVLGLGLLRCHARGVGNISRRGPADAVHLVVLRKAYGRLIHRADVDQPGEQRVEVGEPAHRLHTADPPAVVRRPLGQPAAGTETTAPPPRSGTKPVRFPRTQSAAARLVGDRRSATCRDRKLHATHLQTASPPRGPYFLGDGNVEVPGDNLGKRINPQLGRLAGMNDIQSAYGSCTPDLNISNMSPAGRPTTKNAGAGVEEVCQSGATCYGSTRLYRPNRARTPGPVTWRRASRPAASAFTNVVASEDHRIRAGHQQQPYHPPSSATSSTATTRRC